MVNYEEVIKKFSVILVILILIGLLLIGCSTQLSENRQETNKSENDKTITVLVEGGSPAFQVAQKTAEEFKRETGYEVRIDAVPYIGVFDKLNAEIIAGYGSHDVAIIDILWFPALASGLRPMDDVVTEDVKADLMNGLVEGGTYKGTIYGMPVWTNCKVLIYRKDLFEDSANKEKFKQQFGYELEPPKNWKEYRDVAKFFTRDTDGDGNIDLYGTSVFGLNNGDSVCSWLDHATQAGAKPLVVDANGKVIVNEEPYVKALQFLTDIYRTDKSAPPETLSMASAETADLFWNGKLAMMLAWGHFYVPSNQKMPGKVGVAPMIAGDAGIGAVPGPWYMVIPKFSTKQDIAVKYVKFMYEKNYLYMDTLGVAARKSVFEEYSKKPGYEHLRAIAETLAAPQTQNRPAIAEWTQIENEALVPAVQSALSGKMTPQQALDQAKSTIEEILNK